MHSLYTQNSKVLKFGTKVNIENCQVTTGLNKHKDCLHDFREGQCVYIDKLSIERMKRKILLHVSVINEQFEDCPHISALFLFNAWGPYPALL